MHSLLLASSSPRRAQLLKEAGYQFEILTIKVSEILVKTLNLDEAIKQIACDKAEAGLQGIKDLKNKDFLVLAGDTLVCIDGRVLGKPENPDQAIEFLSLLSGQTHEVKTAICLLDAADSRKVAHCETSKVQFRKLSHSEILEYVKTGEPMDKAGAYGVQGLGGSLIVKVDGSLRNVVGLPVEAFERLLSENKWNVTRA